MHEMIKKVYWRRHGRRLSSGKWRRAVCSILTKNRRYMPSPSSEKKGTIRTLTLRPDHSFLKLFNSSKVRPQDGRKKIPSELWYWSDWIRDSTSQKTSLSVTATGNPDFLETIFGSESRLQLIWQKCASLGRKAFCIPFKKETAGCESRYNVYVRVGRKVRGSYPEDILSTAKSANRLRDPSSLLFD